jgi:hypothetical protein
MNIRDAIAAAKSGEKIKRDAYSSVIIGYDGMEFRFWEPDIKEYGCRVVFTHEDQEAKDWHIYEDKHEKETKDIELLHKALIRIEMLENENRYLKDKIKRIGTMIEIVQGAVNKE